jgi:hypothetical protein
MLEALLIIIEDMKMCALPTSHTMRDLEHSESKIPRPERSQPFMLEALLFIQLHL